MGTRGILNMERMLLGAPSQMKNVVRFSNSHRNNDESVAEHSFGTALYCLVIGEDLRAGGLKIDVELAVKRALIHDLEESRTGDLIRTFKHGNKELSMAIEKEACIVATSIFKELAPRSAEHLTDMWANAKDGTMEGALVEFADFLSAIAYLLCETERGNWTIVKENGLSFGDYAGRFNKARYDFLRPYVNDAHKLLFATITKGGSPK